MRATFPLTRAGTEEMAEKDEGDWSADHPRPLVSIVTVVKDGAGTLERTIQSVLA
jgi:hypothetical protein